MTKDIARNWLIKEVADLRQISECSTLRKSCQNHIESKLTPLIAFILSKLDMYDNMDVIHDRRNWEARPWLRDMWLWALGDEEMFKLSYDDMRSDNTQRKEFECRQWPRERSDQMHARLPFFWLVVNKLDDLCGSFFRTQTLITSNIRPLFLRTVTSLFQTTAQFRLFDFYASANILDAYINDFLLLKTEIRSQKQMDFVRDHLKKKVIQLGQSEIRAKLSLVHFEFELLRWKIDKYLKFSEYNIQVTDKLERLGDFTSLDVESCLATIDLFERDYQKLIDFEAMRVNLEQLLTMIRNLISAWSLSTEPETQRHELVRRKYDQLRFFRLYLADVVLKEPQDTSALETCFNDAINFLKIRLIKDSHANLCFKSSGASIDMLNDLCTRTWQRARLELLNEGARSKCCAQEKQLYHVFFTNDCNCRICTSCVNYSKSQFDAQTKTVLCIACRKSIRIVSNKFNVKAPSKEITIALNEIP